MVYLSRILLDVRQRNLHTVIGNCHELHTFVLRGFPQVVAPMQPREHFGVLFRLETLSHTDHTVRLLVQSQQQPDWSWIKPAWLAAALDQRGNPAVRLVDNEYAAITTGATLFFRLRANPTKRISSNNTHETEQWHKKRVDLRSDEDRVAWLERQGEQHGFRLIPVADQPDVRDVRVIPQARVQGRQKANQTLTFGAVIFEGLLHVTEQERFQLALEHGIGKGKAYGFGLMSVAVLGSTS